jgi:hypothetical protein
MATVRLPVLNDWMLGQIDRKLTPMVEERSAAVRVPVCVVQRLARVTALTELTWIRKEDTLRQAH